MAYWTKTFVVDDDPNVMMRCNEGHVKIGPAEDRRVNVQARDRGIRLPVFGVWDVRRLQVRDSHSLSRIQLDVAFPRIRYLGGFVLPFSRVLVTVPRRVGLDIETYDGGIVLSGNIDASTDGDLEAIAQNGNIRAAGGFGALNLQSNSGNIRVELAAGCRMKSDWKITAWNGNIDLQCPPDLVADLDADAKGGRVLVDLPSGVPHEGSSYREALNGGGCLLRLRSTNGHIRIQRAGTNSSDHVESSLAPPARA